MEEDRQLHPLAALSLGKTARYPLFGEQGGGGRPHTQYGFSWEYKKTRKRILIPQTAKQWCGHYGD
jgi:hypothetical protein